MKKQPNFLTRLHAEVSDARLWWDRAVVIVFAVMSGLAVVAFTYLADWAYRAFNDLRTAAWWAPLLWTPGLTALIVWLIRRGASGASGSGIPQVLTVIDSRLPADAHGRFVSLRLSLAKVLGVSGGLLAGLSLGRQGPSVQVGAGVMHHARHYLSPRSTISGKELAVAGGAAGLAAAFNTPLGGIVFAIEELSRRLEQRTSGLVLVAIVVSGLVSVSVFGDLAYFGRIRIEPVSWWALVPSGALVAIVCGLLGGLLSRLLIVSFKGMPDRACAYRRRFPVRFATLCGFGVAVIGVVSGGQALGGGHQQTAALLMNQEVHHHVPVLLTWLRFTASWLSAWSGIPAGIFGPSLSMGASVGADIAWLLESPHRIALVALGMAAFLSAVTQTPITAMIIMMEMTDGHGMVLSLLAVAMLASAVSRMISEPLYGTMSAMLLRSFLSNAPERPRV